MSNTPLPVIRSSSWSLAIIATLGLALLLLSGCSAVRFGYNRAPDLAYWWLDGYADFNAAQKPQVRSAIAGWFAWHRRTQLTDYADLLARAEVEAAADTTPERACQWWADVGQRVDAVTDQVVLRAADVILTLTPAQIARIEKRYAKFNDDFRDDYLQPDLAERQREAQDRTVERTEMLYGRLDKPQRALIAEMLAASPFDPELWFSERQRRQQEALALLRKLVAEGAGHDQAEAALRGYFLHMKQSPNETYRRYADRLTQFNCGFTARLHNAMHPAQRQTAVGKLKGWEGDLRALAADAGG